MLMLKFFPTLNFRGTAARAGRSRLNRPVWGGHSCPPPLMLMLKFFSDP